VSLLRLLPLAAVAPVAAHVLSCGGAVKSNAEPATALSAAPVAAPVAEPSTEPPVASASAAVAPAPPAQIPTACADPAASICAPPSDFVDRLCARPRQEATLALFAKAMPFTRLYLRGKLDELAWDEEVLVLRFHAAPKNGIVVGSGAGTYDVLRWDGSCSKAVEAEILSRNPPPKRRTAHVKWDRLGDEMQAALINQSEAVKRACTKRGKECKGAMSGDVSGACERADAELVQAVVDYVSGGGTLPPAYAP
jgi:hypothetical protein